MWEGPVFISQYDPLPRTAGDKSFSWRHCEKKQNLTTSSVFVFFCVTLPCWGETGECVREGRLSLQIVRKFKVYCLRPLEMIPAGTGPRSWSLLLMTGSMSIGCTYTQIHTDSLPVYSSCAQWHTHTQRERDIINVLSTPALWRCSELISTLIIDSEFNLKGRRTASQGTLL